MMGTATMETIANLVSELALSTDEEGGTLTMSAQSWVVLSCFIKGAEVLAEENQRLRDIAACCYAGLGAEHELPEPWLDALYAAAEGKPFETEHLLPYEAAERGNFDGHLDPIGRAIRKQGGAA